MEDYLAFTPNVSYPVHYALSKIDLRVSSGLYESIHRRNSAVRVFAVCQIPSRELKKNRSGFLSFVLLLLPLILLIISAGLFDFRNNCNSKSLINSLEPAD